MAVDGYDVVDAVGVNIELQAHGLRVVLAVDAVGGRVLRVVGINGSLLV